MASLFVRTYSILGDIGNPEHVPLGRGVPRLLTGRTVIYGAGDTTERFRGNGVMYGPRRGNRMANETLSVRAISSTKRQPKLHDAFDRLAANEALPIVNDHEPKPLFYVMQAEADDFDAAAYSVEGRGAAEFSPRSRSGTRSSPFRDDRHNDVRVPDCPDA